MENEIVGIIYRAIDEYNRSAGCEYKIIKELDSIIYGRESGLDSLGLANLIIFIEDGLLKSYELKVCLVDVATINDSVNPFYTVKSLARFIKRLIKEKELSINH